MEEHRCRDMVHKVGSSSYIGTLLQLKFECDCSMRLWREVDYWFGRFEGFDHCVWIQIIYR